MKTKKTLVLGASLKPNRYSNLAVNKLVRHDQPVVALGLREGEIAGVSIDTGYPEYKDIHTVTLYLNPQRQQEYYEYIISLDPERVIFNPGTENPEFYSLLKEKDIKVVPACTLVMLSTNQY